MNKIIVDKIDGIHYIYSNNGGPMLESEGEYHSERVMKVVVQLIINKLPGKFLKEEDIIEFKEITGGRELPTKYVKMSEYLEVK